jgi:heavy metal-binding protein
MTHASVVAFICPMHSDVHAVGPGKCPKCGMDLLPEGTRFALMRHLLATPAHLVLMMAVMVAVMLAAMTVLTRFAF